LPFLKVTEIRKYSEILYGKKGFREYLGVGIVTSLPQQTAHDTLKDCKSLPSIGAVFFCRVSPDATWTHVTKKSAKVCKTKKERGPTFFFADSSGGRLFVTFWSQATRKTQKSAKICMYRE
jgi:hypothetical protein